MRFPHLRDVTLSATGVSPLPLGYSGESFCIMQRSRPSQSARSCSLNCKTGTGEKKKCPWASLEGHCMFPALNNEQHYMRQFVSFFCPLWAAGFADIADWSPRLELFNAPASLFRSCLRLAQFQVFHLPSVLMHAHWLDILVSRERARNSVALALWGTSSFRARACCDICSRAWTFF